MANKPEDPNRPRPADKKTQHKPPTSDSSIEGLEGAVSAAREAAKKKEPGEFIPADEAIDFASTEDAEGSGISVIEWASLAESPPAGSKGAPPTQLQVDSPSDADLLNAPAGRKGEASPPSPRNTMVAKEGEMAAMMGQAQVPHKPGKKKEDSAIDLTADAIVVEDDSSASASGGKEDSAIDLTADAVVVEEPASGPRKAAGSDSGIDLGADSGIDIEPALPQVGTDSKATGNESGIDLIAEDVILETSKPSSNGGSSRDLIAEGLESGVDLPGKKKKTEAAAKQPTKASKKPTDEEDALDEFIGSVGHEDQTSSVDLGSMHNIEVFKDEDRSAPAKSGGSDSGINAEDLAAPSGAVDVDLEATAMDSGVAAAKIDEDVEGDEPRAADLDSVTVGAAAEDVGGDEPRAADVEVAEADEAEAKPRKKVAAKQGGRSGGWIGGTVLGAVVGSAACLGLWVFGIEPPTSLREMAGTATAQSKTGPSTGAAPQSAGPGPGVVAPQATFAGTLDHIKSGALDKVKSEDLNRAEENNAEHLVARAEYRWLNYLKSERTKDPRAKFKVDAEPVKQALADLDKAIALKNADALFLRGQIHEMTDKTDEARKDYQKGVEEFKADAAQRLRFETAIQVLDLTQKVAHLAPAGMEPRQLALLLIALQAAPGDGKAPPPPGGAAAPTPDEAGFRFWQAIKAARESKWAEAVKALDEARARHDQRRFLLPRKPQNPASDPREEIFLRTADEVKAYWTMLDRLSKPGYLAADPKERFAPVDKLMKEAQDSATAAQLKDLAEKLAKGKPVAKPEELVKLVADERKASADKITGLEGTVTDQKKKIEDLDGTLVKTKKELASSQDMLKASVSREKGLQAANDAANTAFKDIGEAVGVKFVDAKSSRAMLVKEVQEAKRIAGVRDPKGTIRKLEGELAVDRAKLKERWEPEQMLAFWLAALQSDRSRTDLNASALRDVERVMREPGASEAIKGRALTIRGLVLRNEEKFAEAKPVLKSAKEALGDSAGAWLKQATDALAEVSNPGADLARKADALVVQGRQDEALALLNRGLKLLPGKKGDLYAKRALIALESARTKGPLVASDPQVASAQKDAAAAAGEGLAEGHYVAGRVAEELGQIDQAIRSYRAAIAAHPGSDASGSLYRVALARALVKSRAGEAPAVRPLPPPIRTGKAPTAPTKLAATAVSVRSTSLLDFTSLMLTMTLQAPDLPTGGPAAREAEKLADEVLAMGDKAPFDVRAQALAVKGLYTRALRTYTAGLREKGLLAPAYANALLDLISNHPMLKRPDTLTVPEPAEGEKHYAAGVNFFFAGRYLDAEKEFVSAVENDNGDARYYYYLGLSRLAQGKREAQEDFDQAARLERLGRPGRPAVSAALERVQGQMRRVLNEVRTRPVKERAK
jgi:tetratricopeptide (TPR) repeat protein